MRAETLVIIMALSGCGGEGPQPERHGSAPISSVWFGPVATTFPGYTDPTSTTYAGGMAPCSASCSSALAQQNTAALQAAVNAAVPGSAPLAEVRIPAGQYPMACVAGQAYAVDLSGRSNLVIDGSGGSAILRFSGAQSGACAMFWVRNLSALRMQHITLSEIGRAHV